MKCYFRSFDVGIGDCNVIRLVDGDQQYTIMVDCGQFTAPVKDYVENDLQKHIDILVATHIDGDHIVGLAKMLTEIPDLQIDHIWFNTYRRSMTAATVELTKQQLEILEWVKNRLPVEFDAINYRREVSAPQAKSLSKIIIEKPELKKVWNVDYITKDTPDFSLPNNFGKIVFLSPTEDALKAVDIKFKDAFNKFFMEQWNDSIENGEELSELLLRLSDAYKSKYELRPVSFSHEFYGVKYITEQSQIEESDNSETNYSSIAFILECGEYKVAMLGDAYSKTVEESLVKKYNNVSACPLQCAAIKLSHHGSNGNSSKSLLGKIQSQYYFIPGGKSDKYPSWGTFGRLVLSHSGKKVVIFSHCCDMSKLMAGISGEVKQVFNVETFINEEEYELFEW